MDQNKPDAEAFFCFWPVYKYALKVVLGCQTRNTYSSKNENEIILQSIENTISLIFQIRAGKEWDELKVVTTLDAYRKQQSRSKGPSFSTIAGIILLYSLKNKIRPTPLKCQPGFGPNGAIIHYRPTKDTNRKIDNTSMLLIDSGGQYLGKSQLNVTSALHLMATVQLN